MTSIEIQPKGGTERIVIRREPSPADSDTATVGSRSNKPNIGVKRTVIIVPDSEEFRRGERVVVTRSESPASDKADTGQGDRWPSTREVIQSSRMRALRRRSESGSQARTRTQSLSIDVRGRNDSKRRSKDTEAWIKEQSENAERIKIEGKKPSSDSRDVALPYGWEARLTDEQPPRTYFVDHVTRKTTWEDPRGHRKGI